MNNTLIKDLTAAEEEYAQSPISIRELCQKYPVQRQTLTGWLLAKGYNVENKRAMKSFNIHYFDEIDTEEKAYWLGFLFADGSVTRYKNSYDIELSLKIEDKGHVEKFAKALGKEYVNNNSTYRSRCIVGSKHMFNILCSYGCTPRKSLTLKFPDTSIFKDESLIRHFIRGYVDGDGCLSFANKEHTKANVSILGTEDFLNGIQKIYKSSKNYSLNNKNNEITKVLGFYGKQGYEFAKFLYEDSTVYLDRKYEKYKQYCRLYQE